MTKQEIFRNCTVSVKDDKGKEVEFNEENTKLLLEAPYIRHLIEEVSSKMGNFSEK